MIKFGSPKWRKIQWIQNLYLTFIKISYTTILLERMNEYQLYFSIFKLIIMEVLFLICVKVNELLKSLILKVIYKITMELIQKRVILD